MKNIFLCLAVLSVYLFTSCGDPAVSIENVQYEPHIVVEGYVYPGEPVQKIWIMRNVPINSVVDNESLYLTPANNSVIATINGVVLQYDEQKKYYFSNELEINYSTEYKFVVDAVIEGENLHTESSTITPQKGFKILNKNLGNIIYRNEVPVVDYFVSPNIGFYAFSINALDADFNTFIYDNPYYPDIDSTSLADDFADFKYQYDLLLNVKAAANEALSYDILGHDTWFYGDYRVIVYAGDKNMKDYLLTAGDVQEFDGNFHEPSNYLSEDGIGVFGSAIRDTLTFTLLPRE